MMTAFELLNELAMSSSFKGHLIVEGETDQRLLRQTLPTAVPINVVPAGNCEAALDVAREYESHAAKNKINVVIFIDRDYQVALKNVEKIPKVVVTELRDIECMMFDSICYERVANEYISDEKLKKNKLNLQLLKQQIIKIAAEFGCIRFASQKLEWNLSLSCIDFEKFTDLSRLELDHSACIKHVNGHQSQKNPGTSQNKQSKRISNDDLEMAFREASSCGLIDHPLLKARGHDLMSIFFLLLKKRIGNKAAQDLSIELLEKTFRISYPEILRNTATFKRLISALSPLQTTNSTRINA